MSPSYLARSLEPVLRRAIAEFPAVVLTGPRQSGKTTLLRRLLGESHGYVAVDLPDVRLAAETDPRGFLDLHPPPVVFDEIQAAPGLLPYVREWIDSHRAAKGQFVLTGSQNLMLIEAVTESLAGRSAQLRLLPLSNRERCGKPLAKGVWQLRNPRREFEAVPVRKLWEQLLRGGYPEIVVEARRDPHLWHASYVETYLERDVRSLRQVGDLTQFQVFLRTLAARSAQLLNMAEISRDLGISLNTVKSWLSILEATHQVDVLRPYFTNIGKRLVKTPKVYFTDVGTLCFLVGLRDPEHARKGPMAGAIFETAVLAEIRRTLFHQASPALVHFWRTAKGEEVDFLVEDEGQLVPIEVKLSATPRPEMARGLRLLHSAMGRGVEPGYVVHPGESLLPLGDGHLAMPFAAL